MSRPTKFSEEQILDAALELVAAGGPKAATVAALSAQLDAPVGSIYHRFKSHDLLLARLWLRTVKRFQAGYLKALRSQDLDAAALTAAAHVVRWTREHPGEARLLLLYRREDLAARWPQELGEELATLNEEVASALRDQARRRFGDGDDGLARVVLALVDLPNAAGRRYLVAGAALPPSLEELVQQACRCLLGSAEATARPV